MIDARFAILAAVITVAGNAVYAVDTVRGNTQPNRVSWMLWTLAPMIAFAAEVTQSVGLQSLLTFAIGFGPLLVVCASFLDPKAYARVTPFDVAVRRALAHRARGLGGDGTGNVAIFLSILADFLGAVPDAAQGLPRIPSQSTRSPSWPGVAGAAITLLTIKAEDWGFRHVGASRSTSSSASGADRAASILRPRLPARDRAAIRRADLTPRAPATVE